MRLHPAATKLRIEIMARFDFKNDAAGENILDTGLRALSTELSCMARIEAEGLTVPGDRGGLKCHPLLAVARDARAQFLSAMKMLDLDADGQPAQIGRPTIMQRTVRGKI